jgi:site-specific DNA-cytosine methylase
LVNAQLIEYYGTGGHTSPERPLPTLTCKPRFGLAVQLSDGSTGLLDIGYRMLHWRETAKAQSFPADYIFTGTGTEIHKQIGNAVPPALAKALFSAALHLPS